MIPVSSRAVQSALAGELQFMTSGGVANINANMAGADFVGITSMIKIVLSEPADSPIAQRVNVLNFCRCFRTSLSG
jgi:hypothetical protein